MSEMRPCNVVYSTIPTVNPSLFFHFCKMMQILTMIGAAAATGPKEGHGAEIAIELWVFQVILLDPFVI